MSYHRGCLDIVHGLRYLQKQSGTAVKHFRGIWLNCVCPCTLAWRTVVNLVVMWHFAQFQHGCPITYIIPWHEPTGLRHLVTDSCQYTTTLAASTQCSPIPTFKREVCHFCTTSGPKQNCKNSLTVQTGSSIPNSCLWLSQILQWDHSNKQIYLVWCR